MNLKIKHIEAVAKLNFILASKIDGEEDVIKIGTELLELGLDFITDGFWLLDISGNIEYYSPKFRASLGFEGLEDFPNVPESWMKQINQTDREKAVEAFNLHLENAKNKYYLPVTYKKKNSDKEVYLICAGTIVNRENPDRLIMLGTHEIIEDNDS